MIKVEHLTKYYGEVLAVSDLSFEIGEGHVYGFLGPNGAGKSTTMNIMTGCLSPSAGSVNIDGHDIFDEPKAAKRLIGYLPEQPPLYMSDTPEEYLRFVGQAKGLRGEKLKAEIENAIDATGIGNVRSRRISALSKGYRQRVGIAQALLGNPQVIILDEPTVGLDPHQILEIRDLIHRLGREHTVIFSSHILSEVQAICDRLLVIAHGKLVAEGEPEELGRSLAGGGEIFLTVDGDTAAAAAILEDVEGVHALEVSEADGTAAFRLSAEGEDLHVVTRNIFRAFAAAGTAILEMGVKRASLEDVFLELTEKDEPPAFREEDRAEGPSPAQTEGGAGGPSPAPIVETESKMTKVSDSEREVKSDDSDLET